MKSKCQLIGGPADGRRATVYDSCDEIVVPIRMWYTCDGGFGQLIYTRDINNPSKFNFTKRIYPSPQKEPEGF